MAEGRTFEGDAAYALTVDCTHCGRKAGKPCIQADSSERRYPHVARFKLSDAFRELRAQQTRK